MRVAVTGATGVLGRAVLPALVGAGHQVVALTRTPQKAVVAESMGAVARVGSIFDGEVLPALLEGCDAVCNFASHVPVGYTTALPWAWKVNDRLRTEGVRRVVQAAKAAGVRRVVQESVSFLYADAGDDWIDERSSLGINRATEPASVGESLVQDYTCGSRTGVVLRLGSVVGDDSLTRDKLRAARNGRPIGIGAPDGWAHVVHTDDVGPAVVAALGAPSGVYNVGAAPVRRGELVQGYAEAVGRARADFLGPLMLRLAGPRTEPLTRSLRVSSSTFTSHTGWAPARPEFDVSWLAAAAPAPAGR
ncbi:MAG TPA: NAD(P)-dependent oxidoreductase [Nocardioidaceae bacterium]|nr:NAD(P)-dependent oxidoreductase [Nocardioidaceae bacterium]